MKLSRRTTTSGLLLVTPTLVGVGAFFIAPLAVLAWLSMQSWDLIGPARPSGFANFATAVTDPRVGAAVAVTLRIGGVALALELVLGFSLGRALARGGRMRRPLTVALLVPWMIAPFAAGLLARWLLAPSDGVLAHALGHRVDILTDPLWALLAVAATIAWQNTGFAAVVFASALTDISQDLRDAAALDGAGAWRMVRSIELPLVTPAAIFLAITGVVRALGVYDVAVPLTGGGPAEATQTITALAVSAARDAGDFGLAATLSLLTGGIALVLIDKL